MHHIMSPYPPYLFESVVHAPHKSMRPDASQQFPVQPVKRHNERDGASSGLRSTGPSWNPNNLIGISSIHGRRAQIPRPGTPGGVGQISPDETDHLHGTVIFNPISLQPDGGSWRMIRALDMFRRMKSRRRRMRPTSTWPAPPRGGWRILLVVVGEAAEKVNGREIYAGRDGRGHRGALGHKGDVDQDFVDALLFLSRVPEAFAPKVWGEADLIERRRTPRSADDDSGIPSARYVRSRGSERLNGIGSVTLSHLPPEREDRARPVQPPRHPLLFPR